MNKKIEELEQCDATDDEFLQKVNDKFSKLVGEFIIEFSYLEHEIGVRIAEYIHDDLYETGYMMTEKLTLGNKIEVYYNCYIRLDSFAKKRKLIQLKLLKDSLLRLNSFRNVIAHADWQTLDKDYFVRTKILVDEADGYVKNIKVQVTPKIIREHIRLIGMTLNKMQKFSESIYQNI